MDKTALHEAAVKGNAEMVAYMMEQVNPNVDARDVVGGIYVLHDNHMWVDGQCQTVLRTAVMIYIVKIFVDGKE